MKNYIRHGDVNMHPFKGEVAGEIISHNGSYVVEYGEVTGHKHTLKVENPNDLIIKKDARGNMYFELLKEGTISHEEHKTLVIKPGVYRKVNEREVDHFLKVTRKVLD